MKVQFFKSLQGFTAYVTGQGMDTQQYVGKLVFTDTKNQYEVYAYKGTEYIYKGIMNKTEARKVLK
jgi:hypothetical protein